MKSDVYLVRTEKNEAPASVTEKLKSLLRESRILEFAGAPMRVALKLHFGEEGNTGFVRPEYLATVAGFVKGCGAQPFLCDTNTLYRGKRTNSKDHLALAFRHGFRPEKVGCPVVIPDDTEEKNAVEIPCQGRYVKSASIARVFFDADILVGVAHFKGHLMAGFGGAIKNIGMGCATRRGKLFQHARVAPVVYEKKCRGCRACVAACPAHAIALDGRDKAAIDSSRCIGCASCIAACGYGAIDVPWESGGSDIQEKMAEYAAAALSNKKNRRAFLNFCVKITKECDCLAKDDPRIAPDVGILASVDPVAVDQACLDLVCASAGRDVFKEAHPQRDGAQQLAHAQALGLGSREYSLRRL